MSTSTKGCKLDLEKALAELLSNPELFLRKQTLNNVTVCNTFLNIFENFPETNLKASEVVDPEEGPFLIYFWTKAEALKAVHHENHKRAFFF